MKKSLHLGNQGGLKHSLREMGRIKKTTLKGSKFEFSENLRENRNYILFVSGMDHEANEIEEIDDFTPQDLPTEEIIEERQIIDNYQYHETKICKKKPKKIYITHHERLSIPLERITLKKYSSYTSQSQPKSYAKTKTVKVSRFGKKIDIEEVNPYNSFILKLKNKPKSPTNLYKTYKPNKNISFAKTKTKATTKKAITEGKNLTNLSTTNIYKNRNIAQMGKDKRLYSPNNFVEYKPNQNTKKNKPERTFTPVFGEKQIRTENKKGGEYLVKIDDSRKQKNEPKPYKMVDGSKPRDKSGKLIIQKRLTPDYRTRSGNEPRGNGNSDIDNFRQKIGEKPRSGSRAGDRLSPYGGEYRPNSGDKLGTYGKPHRPQSDDKPRPYDSPRPGNIVRQYIGSNPDDKPRIYSSPRPRDMPKSYGGSKPDDKSGYYGGTHSPKPVVKPGPPHGPRPGNIPKPYGGPHGPKSGVKLGSYGGPLKPKPDYKAKPFGQKPINNQGSYERPNESKPIDRSGIYKGSKPSDRKRSAERSKSFDRQNSPSSLRISHGLRPTIRQGLRGPNVSNKNPATRNKPKETPKFNDRVFAGKRDRSNVGKPGYDDMTSPSKTPGIHSREDNSISDGKYKPSQSYKTLTENNYTFSSKNLGQKPQMAFQSNKRPSDGDNNNNYNYNEFKHAIKQGKLNLPVTIHHIRDEDDESSQKYQINSSYNQSSQNVKSNLTNRYHHNSNLQIKNKSNFRKDKENKKSINRKVTFLIN